MAKKKRVLIILWIVIAVLAIISIASLIIYPHWKGIFFAGSGGFLILNILLSMFFINRNYKN